MIPYACVVHRMPGSVCKKCKINVTGEVLHACYLHNFTNNRGNGQLPIGISRQSSAERVTVDHSLLLLPIPWLSMARKTKGMGGAHRDVQIQRC